MIVIFAFSPHFLALRKNAWNTRIDNNRLVLNTRCVIHSHCKINIHNNCIALRVQSENNVWISLSVCRSDCLPLFPCLSAALPLCLPPLLPLALSPLLSVSCLLLFISPSHLSWVLRTRHSHSHSHSAVTIAENYSYSLNMASSGQCSSPSCCCSSSSCCCCCCSLSVLIIFRWYSLQGIIITIITTIRRIPRFFSFYFSFSFRSPADCRYHTHTQTHVRVCVWGKAWMCCHTA